MSWMFCWQLAIGSQMIGLESLLMLEILQMIADLQTLGTPISYTSIPGTVSASIGVMLIPTLGIIMDRWGQTRRSKAKILTLTTFAQFMGSMLIFTANGFDLLYTQSDTNSTVNYTETGGNFLLPTLSSHPSQRIPSSMSNSTNPNPSIHSSVYISPFDTNQMDIPDTFSQTAIMDTSDSSGAIPWNAYIAMAGYALTDFGYDSSSCFLKMFIFECSPQELHPSLILKSFVLASLGGVTVTILGSVNLGQMLTAGTDLDPNSALCCFLAALGACFLIVGYSISILTGFLWRSPIIKYQQTDNAGSKERGNPEVDENEEKEENAYEKSKLISSTKRPSYSFQHNSATEASPTYKSSNNEIGGEKFGSDVDISKGPPKKTGFLAFIHRQRKQILLNMMTFCMLSSIYSYENYYVNFIGEGIFGGDPSAPLDSDEYNAYLDGVSVGSQGLLIFSVTFAVYNLVHEKIYSFMGWKLEAIIVILVYGGLTLATALTLNLYVNYVATVASAVCRAIFLTTPYILANKFSAEQNGGKSSGAAIAFLTAMLPAGFVICSAIMGPLIDFTGNPAANVYYASATAFLGLIFILFVRE